MFWHPWCPLPRSVRCLGRPPPGRASKGGVVPHAGAQPPSPHIYAIPDPSTLGGAASRVAWDRPQASNAREGGGGELTLGQYLHGPVSGDPGAHSDSGMRMRVVRLQDALSRGKGKERQCFTPGPPSRGMGGCTGTPTRARTVSQTSTCHVRAFSGDFQRNTVLFATLTEITLMECSLLYTVPPLR